MAGQKQPNILYIMADQMAAPMLAMYDASSPVKTPTLDRLAKDGVVFESAYCNSPLCAPSRFSMVTGQLPSKINGYDNASELASDIPTYAHYLRKEGYHTALAGKMHFIGTDQLHGFEQRLTSDIYPGDFGWSVNWDEPEVRADWYHDMSSVLEASPVIRTNQLDYDNEVVYKSTQYLYDHIRYRNGQPFCLTVSMTHPHDPYAMTQDFWDLYEDVDIPLPKTPAIPQDQQDPHSKRLLKCIDLWDREMPEERIRAARRAYFAACTYVDTQITKLLCTLDACGLAKDTIVVFTGDHGDMLGERGLWYKMAWYEMAARVPMLVYAPGRYEPKRVRKNVSTMDLLPTFVEMIGNNVHPSLPLDGVSLMPYINASVGAKSDTVLGEYMGEGTLSPVVMIRRGRWKFIYSPMDPPQLFDISGDPTESTNLAANFSGTAPARTVLAASLDATEQVGALLGAQPLHISTPVSPYTSNKVIPPSPPRTPQNAPALATSPSDQHSSTTTNPVPSLHSIFTSFLEETLSRWDFDAITQDVLVSQRRRRLVYSALIKGKRTVWDYTPPADGAAMYVRNNSGKGALGNVEWMNRWPRVGGD